jgi:hypothetical protein
MGPEYIQGWHYYNLTITMSKFALNSLSDRYYFYTLFHNLIFKVFIYFAVCN